MEMIEVTANSVQAAIDKGLAQLQAKASDVVVEVLDEPNTGLFGFGARQARVRLVLLNRPTEEAAPTITESDSRDDSEVAAPAPQPGTVTHSSPETELDDDARVGIQVLEELLGKMRISAQIEARRSQDEALGDENHWLLNITGSRVNRLIGRRGETLQSLQHIVRLICSRRLERRANIVIDAGGYKEGRAKRLRGLAQRMAQQAVQQGRTITLEPMQASERRIVHLALRRRQDVLTRSIGEGNARKVTIVPQ